MLLGLRTAHGSLENYAKRVFCGKTSPFVGRDLAASDYVFDVGDLDYHILKLYLMSLLWRMGESGHPYYTFVRLGPHAERLRQKLLESNPSESWRYGCSATVLLCAGMTIPAFFSQPLCRKTAGRTFYELAAAGLQLDYYVGNSQCALQLKRGFLQSDGTWRILRQEVTDYPRYRVEIDLSGYSRLLVVPDQNRS